MSAADVSFFDSPFLFHGVFSKSEYDAIVRPDATARCRSGHLL
jgi:hypothetical protein